MAYKDYKNTESAQRGRKAEIAFMKTLKKHDIYYEKSTTHQNTYEHIDFFVKDKKGVMQSFDVKSAKKVSRGDFYTNSDIAWLEFVNNAGSTGWLLAKKLSFIAFDRGDDFLIVRRADLAKMAKEKCDMKNRVFRAKDALYKGYNRAGNSDLITKVLMTDILELKTRVLPK